MLPTSVVSFMKKMTQTEQNTLPDAFPITPATQNSGLCKLKKTLTASLNQVQISAKATLSAKGIGFPEKDVGDLFRKKSINKDSGAKKPHLHEEEIDCAEINMLDTDFPKQNKPSQQSAETHSAQSGLQQRHDRLASCRVCVRSLSSGNEAVSFRFCSECNYKVCEDCASYSDQDCDLEQSFWRCSICRRRSASPRQTSAETVTLSLGNSSRRGTFASDSSESQLLHESHDGSKHSCEKEKPAISRKSSASSRTDVSLDYECNPKINTGYSEDAEKTVSSNEMLCSSSDNSRSLASISGLYSEHRRQSFRSNRSRNLAEDTDGPENEGGRGCSTSLQNRFGVHITPANEDRARHHRSPSPSNRENSDFTLSPGGTKERSPMHRRSINQSRSRSASAHEEAQASSFDADHIRIVVDHVDSTGSELEGGCKKSHYNTSRVRLHREASFPNDYLFTDSFGLSLAEGDETEITYIKPVGPAHKAGLECGDVIISWDGIKLAGRSIWDVHEDLKHSGDSIEVVVMKGKSRSSRNIGNYDTGDVDVHFPQRPNCLAAALLSDSSSRSEKNALASPTRRRLPRAPLLQCTSAEMPGSHGSKSELRILLKVMVFHEESDLSRVSITVLNAERSLLSTEQHRLEEESLNKHMFWIQVKLQMPRGAVKEFSTEPIGFKDTMDCTLSCVWSGLQENELVHAILNISAWGTSPHSETIQLGESSFSWRNVQTDGRPFWVSFDSHAVGLSEDVIRRRLSKASSHDPDFQYHRNYDAEQEPTGSNESFKNFTENIERNVQDSFQMCNIPRSRSAEANVLKLDIPNTSEYGLSAPASLAPSRRNSSLLFEDDRESKLLPNVRCNSFSTNDLFKPEDMKRNLSASYENIPQAGDEFEERTYHDSDDRDYDTGICNKPPRRSFSHHTAQSGRKLPNPYHDPLGHSDKTRGQVKLGIIAYHGQIDVEVISAKNLPLVAESNMEPDTFIQVTLSDCNGILEVQKTKTMRQTSHPKFHQTLSFKCTNKPGLVLNVDAYAEDVRKQCATENLRYKGKTSSTKRTTSSIGGVNIAIDNLPIASLTISWYRIS